MYSNRIMTRKRVQTAYNLIWRVVSASVLMAMVYVYTSTTTTDGQKQSIDNDSVTTSVKFRRLLQTGEPTAITTIFPDSCDIGDQACTCLSTGCFCHNEHYKITPCQTLMERFNAMMACNNFFGSCTWEEACCSCNREPSW